MRLVTLLVSELKDALKYHKEIYLYWQVSVLILKNDFKLRTYNNHKYSKVKTLFSGKDNICILLYGD